MEEKKPTSKRRVIIFISYSHSHSDKPAAYGLWQDLKKHRTIRRMKIDIEIDRNWKYKDSKKEKMGLTKVADFTIAYISGDYFRSTNCIDELMSLFERENPKESLLQVMDPNYKNRFDKKHFDKESKKITQYWEKKDRKKANFLEETLSILEDEIYKDLEELRREDYKSMIEYVQETHEKREAKEDTAFTTFSKQRDIALEEYKEKYNNSKLNDCIKKGVHFFENRSYDKAIEYYNIAIRLKSDSAIAYNNRGNAYSAQGKYNKAVEDYNEAIRLKPNYVEAYYNRGNLYAKRGKYEEAIKDYTKAINVNPKLSGAFNNRGILYGRQGKHEEAMKDYNEAINVDPQNTAPYNNRGLAYDRQEKHEEAIKDYNEAIRLKPDLTEAYYNKGLVYLNKKKWGEAIKNFNKAIHLQPNLALAYKDRSLAYARIGETEKAKADIAMARRLNPFLFQ